MATCPKCNAELPDEAVTHCPSCSEALHDEPAVTAEVTQSDTPPPQMPSDPDAATIAADETADLIVPQFEQPSMLSQVGLDAGVSLSPTQGVTPESETVPDLQGSATRPGLARDMLSEGGTARYQVGDEINRGGMGAIIRTMDTDIRREVAMKVILKDGSEEHRVRFVEEAQVQGQLEHPNIVPVHELGIDSEGRLYFTMKMLRGRSLKEIVALLRDGDEEAIKTYSRARMLEVFQGICNAMAFAHSRGVVHRDLKPENVMLGDFGEVLVLDWGLAKVGAARSASSRRLPGKPSAQEGADAELMEMVQSLRKDSDSGMTLDGSVMGTPQYMPPEQAEGKVSEIDERSDVYALGALLYEMLTYRPAIQGETTYQVLLKVADGDFPPPRERSPERDIPAELETVVMKAMATDKTERYSSVDELQQALRDYQTHAESIVLATQAEKELLKATRSKDYNDFARAMFTYEQASALWEGNKAAKHGARAARLAYASCAFSYGDLELAGNLLSQGNLNRTPLADRVRMAQSQRKARQRQLKTLTQVVLGSVLLLLLMSIVAAFWINRERRAASEERDRAVLAEKDLRVALDSANKARQQAVLAAERADKEQAKAEELTYISGISLAAKEIDDAHYSRALGVLESVPVGKRAWEWYRLQTLCHLDDQSYSDCGGRVVAGALSRDGDRVAFLSNNGIVTIWNTDEGELLQRIEGIAERRVGPSASLSFFSGDKLLAVVNGTKIDTYETDTGKRLRAFSAHKRELFSFAISRDERYLATCARDKFVRVWENRGSLGEVLLFENRERGLVFCMDFTGDSQMLALGDNYGHVRVLDTKSGKEALRVSGDFGFAAWDLSFSPDGKHLSAVLGDHRVHIWEVATGELKWMSGKMPADLRTLAYSGRGTHIAAAGSAGIVHIWETKTFERLPARVGAGSSIAWVGFSPDDERLVCAPTEGAPKLWRWRHWPDPKASLAPQVKNYGQSFAGIAFSKTGTRLAVASGRGCLTVYTVPQFELEQKVTGQGNAYFDLSIHPDGRHLAFATEKKVGIWDLAERKLIRSYPQLIKRGVPSVCFSDDGRCFVRTNPTEAVVEKFPSGDQLRSLEDDNWKLAVCQTSHDGRLLALGGTGNEPLSLWDIQSGKKLLSKDSAFGPCWALAFSPSDAYLAVPSGPGEVAIWDIREPSILRTIPVSQAYVFGLAYSADGRRLACAGSPMGEVSILDVGTGREMLAWKPGFDRIGGLAFSPENRYLVPVLKRRIAVRFLFRLGRENRDRRWFEVHGC